uniref:Troponin I 4 n=1 Tax=Strongyloides papillosus TaxID=174720 RepID=A0A0N5B387_STREA
MCDFLPQNIVDEDEVTLSSKKDTYLRYGGAQENCDDEEEEEEEEEEDEDEEDEEEKRRVAERERKKEEVRKRLMEASRAKKAKKGFLTPERKKKLRKLLMEKAAEDLKQQQMLREQERQRILQERIIPLPDLEGLDDDEMLETAKEFVDRIKQLESDVYDLNYYVRQKDFEINELTIAVNDLRGKFVKPTLKKVSKTDNRFDKLKKKETAKVDFRSNLKTVESNKFAMEEEKEKEKLEWAK